MAKRSKVARNDRRVGFPAPEGRGSVVRRTGASGRGTGTGDPEVAASSQNTQPGGGAGQDGSGCQSVVGVKPSGTGHPGGGTNRTAMGSSFGSVRRTVDGDAGSRRGSGFDGNSRGVVATGTNRRRDVGGRW